MNTTNGTRADTKHNLILSALGLFAAQGIDAVSMRTINANAGARNASAVHYHFGNKLGIIEAIIEFIRGALESTRLPALEALEARAAAADAPSCREVMWAVFEPYYRLNRTPGHGRASIRFLARLHTDMSPDLQRLLNHDPHETARRIDELLAGALPDLPPEVRRTRYLYAWALMVQGFASTGSWEHTAFGNLRAPSGDVALMRFFDYLVGGLEAPVTHG
ncbi:MAG TPA: TetR/AcrR family transcriptional regulator [Pseudomonadales bacterium]|nr:TetR/AcrR family transcriptional regulator [Pseudomonadales bacterium]